MASSPINGARPSVGGFRRSSSNFASIPQRSLSFHERAGLAKDDAAANVLYTHPNVRIYKFQPPTDALRNLDKTQKTLPDADYPIDAIEVLPWRARTETLSAKGRLIIEKVQGSVHFLKAGDLIHTIMKNSQCWCVDGESRFVMRVGKLKYQRIEFPTAEEDEKQKVEEFKQVISQILKFEKTPCPFTRSFHVDLPQDAITPRRRGTWKRRESLTPVTPDQESPVVRKAKASRTMSMRGMPPNSFPSRSMSQLDRPRTASTPTSSARFSFPDVRAESPTNYTSGEENTDSDRQDSEPEKPESGHHSEVDESDREAVKVPIIRSPLKNVETLPPSEDHGSKQGTDKLQQDMIPQPQEETTNLQVEPLTDNILHTNLPPQRHGTGDAEANLAEPLPLTATESVEKQERPDVSSPAVVDGHEATNDTLVVGIQISADETLKVNVMADTQGIADDALVSASTENRGHDTKSEGREDRLLADEQFGDKDYEKHLIPAAQISSPPSQPEDAIPRAPSSGSQESLQLDMRRRSDARDGISSLSASAIPQPEISSDTATEDSARTRTDDDTESIVSTDSFHTLFSDDSHTMSEGLLNTRPFQHRRELSEMTVTAASMNYDNTTIENEQASPHELTSTESGLWPEKLPPGAFTDSTELRRRLSHRRSLSPLPPASILTAPNRVDQTSPIPKELLQKAATLAVVKPIKVVMFVVHILSRVAQGATMSDLMSGDLFRRPGARRTASGTFEQNIRGRPVTRDSDDEDDYGFVRRMSSNRDSDQPEYVNGRNDDAASLASID
ncbi:hypothetical protein OHC33_010030 [Knufia fluminis]|uniref:Inheritance of peroxisomes protein 1 n=1 Tax=Knufia fluminis TaxID=191047 RepID=A0AAN8E8H2_9EURO|nr:hypothetical protein OHC33_010030 [Knufia fluminis]